MMILVNGFLKKGSTREDFETFIKILSPFAPHMAEEIWNQFGHKESIFKEIWPAYDQKLIEEKTIALIVQVNGKVRARMEAEAGISQKKAKETALLQENIWKWTAGRKIKKVIFVPDKLINFVV